MAGSESAGRERLNRLALEARALQGQGQELGAQLEALRQASAQARDAIESLNAAEGGSRPGFVPLGAGVFMPAEAKEGKVLVEVGAGVLVEKERGEAVLILEARVKEIGEAQGRMQSGATRLSARMRAIDAEARALVGGMQGEPGME